ncbi:hypothetical protein [Streptosporangium sp. NPDC002721]|uniref:hypothetical protein n=1 Tax=Streptosporangium sp. NPDC002721 TaxID=3366188 RepID=UPI0036D148B1
MTNDFPHGTVRGYRRHLKEKTVTCDDCLAARRTDRAAKERAREAAGKPPRQRRTTRDARDA